MPLRHAEITRHAWLRFLHRWEGEPPACYRTELDRLIAIATEEDLGGGAVIRTILNGFEPARYFIADNWRIVTDEGLTKIMTIERPYLAARKPIKQPRKKPRNRKRGRP